MEGRSDNTALALVFGAAILAVLGHEIFDILFEEWLKQLLAAYFSLTVAEVVERLGSIAVPTVAAFAIVWALVRILKRDYERQLSDALNKPEPAFEFIFDPMEPWVRTDSVKTMYYVGLRILSPQTVDHPNVMALASPFTERVFAEMGREASAAGDLRIYQGGALDPSVTEPISLFGLPNNRKYLRIQDPNDVLQKMQRFTLEARGRRCVPVRAEFEYDPGATPMITMLR
jgi:hypothetical protein